MDIHKLEHYFANIYNFQIQKKNRSELFKQINKIS